LEDWLPGNRVAPGHQFVPCGGEGNDASEVSLSYERIPKPIHVEIAV